MNNPEISIIIPVYNAEKYLEKSLGSIVKQTIKDKIEVICIDDSSTDNSLTILRKFEKEYSNFKILTQDNSGPGVARNLGLFNSNGNYIMFMDSDDWLKENTCEKLLAKIKKDDVDIVFFNATYYNETTKQYSMFTRIKGIYDKLGENVFKASEEYEFLVTTTREAWYKIYKQDFLKKHNILFSDERRGEDTPFWLNMLLSNPTASILYEELYYYRIGLESSVSSTGCKYLTALSNIHNYSLNRIINSDLSEHQRNLFINSQINWFFWWTTYKYSTEELYANVKLRKKYNKILLKKYGKLYLKKIIKNPKFWLDYPENLFIAKIKKILQKVFSIKNEVTQYNKHKIITFLGIKIKKKIDLYGKQKKKYNKTVKLLRKKALKQPISIAFIINDISKWKCDYLFKLLLKHKKFKPFILITKGHGSSCAQNEQSVDDYLNSINFFKKKGYPIKLGYDIEKGVFCDINKFEFDIIFYQHPWEWHPKQDIINVINSKLTCYVPYFIATSYFASEYNRPMHFLLFRHYLLNDKIKSFYEEQLKKKMNNYKIVGHPILDQLNAEVTDKTGEQKCIIYAPHWSIGDLYNDLKWATFEWSGKVMLDFAKEHREYKYIFKPHPVLKKRLEICHFMTKEEITQYWNEWKNIGIVCEDSDYIDLFSSSNVLVTDCGSFLTEYAVTEKPIIFLKSKNGKKHNPMIENLVKSYYIVNSKDELVCELEKALKQDNKKYERIRTIKKMNLSNSCASKNIINDLESILKIVNKELL